MKWQRVPEIPPSRQNVYAKAVIKWGGESQFNMLIEECAELIFTVRHHDRSKCGLKRLVEELVDVMIMIEQVRVMYDSCPFDEGDIGSFEDSELCKNATSFDSYMQAVLNEKMIRLEKLVNKRDIKDKRL